MRERRREKERATETGQKEGGRERERECEKGREWERKGGRETNTPGEKNHMIKHMIYNLISHVISHVIFHVISVTKRGYVWVLLCEFFCVSYAEKLLSCAEKSRKLLLWWYCLYKWSLLILLINVIWELQRITCAEYIHVVSLLTCINNMLCVCEREYLSFIEIILIWKSRKLIAMHSGWYRDRMRCSRWERLVIRANEWFLEIYHVECNSCDEKFPRCERIAELGHAGLNDHWCEGMPKFQRCYWSRRSWVCCRGCHGESAGVIESR